ncbi:MAG: redoxin domain-containing protein [Candidatus Hydrogenedentes bacterium]|nr:redoxin domain-containing protein [Candidatus Hydrogenedentota bacterium]
MKCWKEVLVMVTLAIAIAVPVMAYETGDAAPDEMTGIQVGDKVPDFRLKDQNGVEQNLNDLLKEGTVALMFYRSAYW